MLGLYSFILLVPLQKIIRLFRSFFFLLLLFIFISIEYKMRVQICVINHKMCNFNGKRSTFKLNFFIIFNGKINFVSLISMQRINHFSSKSYGLMKICQESSSHHIYLDIIQILIQSFIPLEIQCHPASQFGNYFIQKVCK